jgi:2-C-methyl-D-erythritol 2,4-cyclodiphosphate synthase
MRVGQGFDVHRFSAGRVLKLCGVTIEGEVGLEGHSDADVALHAVTDAVLGAVALGDLGEHFPPDDAQWKDSESSVLLRAAIAMAAKRGFVPVNCDVTIVAQRPRIAAFRTQMRAALASFLDLDVDQVSVKATTTEQLGSLGRGEGIGAMAVVLMGATDE